jgi:hypothetical protein
MKPSITLLLFLTMLLAASCDKQETEDPAPEVLPEATSLLNRSIYYLETGARLDTTFQTKAVRAFAAQSTKELKVGVSALPSSEGINFTFDRTQLTPDLVGTYPLKTITTVNGAPTNAAFVSYFYDLRPTNGTGTYLYLSSTAKVSGTFTITAYDVRRKLLSGQYEAVFTRTKDPNSPVRDTDSWYKCDITVKGSFDNVPLTEE